MTSFWWLGFLLWFFVLSPILGILVGKGLKSLIKSFEMTEEEKDDTPKVYSEEEITVEEAAEVLKYSW